MRRLPDLLTYIRVALTLATYPVVLAGDLPLFTVLVLVIVITDMLDGPIARRMGIADKHGSNLDSSADFLFYASLPVWVYAFRPDVVTGLIPYIAVYFVAYVAVNVLSKMRRGVMGFHNRWTRFAGTLGVFYALWVVIWGLDPVLFIVILALLTLDLAQRFVHLFRPSGEPPAPPGGAQAPAAVVGRKE